MIVYKYTCINIYIYDKYIYTYIHIKCKDINKERERVSNYIPQVGRELQTHMLRLYPYSTKKGELKNMFENFPTI